MFKKITNKKEYELNPILTTSSIDDIKVNLFGKDYFFHEDIWMRNIHLKITDTCNAKCWFCIEKKSNVSENRSSFMKSLKLLLKQMYDQNSLYTVTITGGEPILCSYLQEIIDEIRKYEVFLTMNTNGRNFKKLSPAPDWINISKHNIDDKDVLKLKNLEITDIEKIRLLSNSKIRIQSVLQNGNLETVNDILLFINKYKNIVDDFSFRQLISGNSARNQPTLIEFRKYLFENADLKEQVFQDYYVYETWGLNNIDITLSFSDMEMLSKSEEVESNRILREVIIHPDGLISGDWDRKNKIIYDPR